MINDETICSVINRSASQVVYNIPDWGIRRSFAPGETQKIPYKELVKLTFQPGGKKLLVSFLQVEADEVLESFNMNVQPEYFMDDKQIIELIKNGSYEAFLDCLDYAPTGVIDLLKKYSVEVPLSDYNKREAMKAKLDFDVDKALANKKAEEAETAEGTNMSFSAGAPKTVTEPQNTARRTEVSYKKPVTIIKK